MKKVYEMKDNKSEYILDVENLVVRYETDDGIVRALNGFDLKLKYRQTIGLVGKPAGRQLLL